MIITHAQNVAGDRRVYLGGKGSLECWIEPAGEGRWSFHVDEAVTGNSISNDDKRAWAIHILTRLADELAIAPTDLLGTPFERIAALHTVNPYDGRRVATPPNRGLSQGFMATHPGSRSTDPAFAAATYCRHGKRR